MTLLVPDVGEAVMLENIVNKTTAKDLVMKLYTNNLTPAEGDIASDYTEATGNGYAKITLTGASWGAAVTGDPSSISYAKQTYTFTGALGDVYGYFMVQAAAETVLVYAERFTGAPYNIVNNGDKIEITPKIELA